MSFNFSIEPGKTVQFGEDIVNLNGIETIEEYAEKIVLPKFTDFSYCSSYAILWGGKGSWSHKPHKNAACFYSMKCSAVGATLVVSCVKEHTSVQAVAFYGWLLNSSPWSEAFISSEIELTPVPHVKVRTDRPSNLIVGGLIATRGPWEFPTEVSRWYTMVQEGMEPNLAYLTCTGTGEGNVPRPWSHNHWPLTTEMSVRSMKTFISGTFSAKHVTGIFSKAPNYNKENRNVYTLFGARGRKTSMEKFYRALCKKKVRKTSGWDGAVTYSDSLGSNQNVMKLIGGTLND